MIYGSVCSGIEAASVAWQPLGFRCAFMSEIEAFPRAVLTHHYPEVPLHGDFTTIRADEYEPIDLLVGGTPCQSFSVAGLRGGMADERGNLALEYLRLAERLRARWLVWENVPGVLSSEDGRDFGSFVGGLAELGYGWAYRVLDAQYFGLAQRRKRVFVVGCLGDWRRAAAVLFEPASLRGDPAPSRKTREDVAPTIAARTRSGGGLGTDFDCDGGLIAKSIPARAWAAHREDSDTFVVARYLNAHAGGRYDGESETFVAFTQNQRDEVRETDLAGSMSVEPGMHQQTFVCGTLGAENLRHITGMENQADMLVSPTDTSAVRRLTPRECERLQGFPDGYTLIPYRGRPAVDGPRYRALGNSMAVPVMRWIGQRIARENAAGRPRLFA